MQRQLGAEPGRAAAAAGTAWPWAAVGTASLITCLLRMSPARMAGGRHPTRRRLRECTCCRVAPSPHSTPHHTHGTDTPMQGHRVRRSSSWVLHPPKEMCRLPGWLPCCCSTKQRAEHVHHDFLDVWSSHVRDLKEFGVGERNTGQAGGLNGHVRTYMERQQAQDSTLAAGSPAV